MRSTLGREQAWLMAFGTGTELRRLVFNGGFADHEAACVGIVTPVSATRVAHGGLASAKTTGVVGA